MGALGHGAPTPMPETRPTMRRFRTQEWGRFSTVGSTHVCRATAHPITGAPGRDMSAALPRTADPSEARAAGHVPGRARPYRPAIRSRMGRCSPYAHPLRVARWACRVRPTVTDGVNTRVATDSNTRGRPSIDIARCRDVERGCQSARGYCLLRGSRYLDWISSGMSGRRLSGSLTPEVIQRSHRTRPARTLSRSTVRGVFVSGACSL